MNLKPSIAEAIGTFALVFTGCGAIIVNESSGGLVGHMGVCLTFGLTIMAMIYSVGNISGAHFNPAVTLGFYFAGRLKTKLLLPYILSQTIGALAAAGLLRLLFLDHPTLGTTAPSGSLGQSFVMEVILSFFLMFVILNVSTGHKEKGIMAGAAIGATVALGALFGGPVSGASMNPARSLGPALLSGQTQWLWIYLSAPVLGAFLAFPLCRWTQGAACCSLKKQKVINE